MVGIVVVGQKFSVLLRACLVIGAAAALAFPPLLPTIYDDFYLYAQPSPGYEMQWVTRPSSKMQSALKSALRDHETSGCVYTLYGWDAENSLYYGSTCQVGFRRYDPQQDTGPKLVWSVPQSVGDVSSVETVARSAGGEDDYAPKPPAGLDKASQYPVHVCENSVSPDGQWEAVVISDFYGPYDLVVLHPES
jgi:hypothetical protein